MNKPTLQKYGYGVNWDDVKVFLAVARANSLTAAGRSLGCDAGTVSRRIARLERSVGQDLFAKSLRGYFLTASGERFMDTAERAESNLLQLVDTPEDVAQGFQGQVRIGAPDGCANFLLPQICSAIARQNPRLDLQIVAQPRVVNLSRREADLAIAVSPPSSGRLRVRKITDYQLILAGSAQYLAGAPPIAATGDLTSHRVVGYIPDMIFDKELDYLSSIGLDRVALASNSVSVQFNMLRQGAGVGFVHQFAVPFAPELRPLLTGKVALTRAFYLIRHEDDARSGRLSALAELFTSALREEVTRLEAKLDSSRSSG